MTRIRLREFIEVRKYKNKGIKDLLEENVFFIMFATHDGWARNLSPQTPENARSILYQQWVKSIRSQPLDKIRQYLGERIGLYFAFLGKMHFSMYCTHILFKFKGRTKKNRITQKFISYLL